MQNRSLLAALGVSIPFLVLFFVYLPHYVIPYEDASIAFSYAQNFANTGVISFYPGGMPAEGASDFLFMLGMAGLVKLGIAAYWASVILNALGGLLVAIFISLLVNKKNWGQTIAIMLIFWLAPPVLAGILGYATLFYAGLLLGAVYFYVNEKVNVLFPWCILLFLARPAEGFIPVALVFWCVLQNRKDKKAKLKALLIFLIPIIAYWIWRWYYFGHFLPLPFYVRTSHPEYLKVFNKDSLYFNWEYLKKFMVAIFGIVVMFIFVPGKDNKRKAFTLFFSLCFLSFIMYGLADMNMNFSLRYQWAMFLGILVSVILLINQFDNIWLNWLMLVLIGFPSIKLGADQWLRAREFNWNNMYSVGKEIGLATHGKGKLATTESGIIPWQSGLQTIDLWGLNTPDFAKDIPQEEDLEAFNPDLLVLHAQDDDYLFLEKNEKKKDREKKSWHNMALTAFWFGWENPGYEIFMVPYDSRLYLETKPKQNLLTKLMDLRYPEPGDSHRYDIFFLKKSYGHYPEVRDILYSFGAISYDTYKTKKYK